MSRTYGLKDVADVTFYDKRTGEILYSDKSYPVKNFEIVNPNPPPPPVDYLVKLDRDVSNVHLEYFRGIGIHVLTYEIDDHPNWMVVTLRHPHTVSSILNLEHVVEAMRVRIEIEEV